MTVLFDSSAWLEYFFGSEKGQKVKPYVEDSEDAIVCCKINVFEVYHKLLKKQGKEDAERFVSAMLQVAHLDELDSDTLKLAAHEKAERGLAMADALILATAIKYDAVLFTTDPDFKKVGQAVKVEFL